MAKRSFISVMGWLATIVLLVGIVMAVRHFCMESFHVSTDSMEVALHKGDYILVNKLPLKDNPGRNRVALFCSPLLKDTVLKPLFLSRCIGMPGDTIRISNDGYRVNGKLIPREAIQTEAGEKAVFRDGKLFLDGREAAFFFFDQDYYWMLSDNANEAVDSRHLGFIPRDHIIGNAWLCWYSKDRQRIFKPIN